MDDNFAVSLGQRVVLILNTGRRETTYKLATLWALIDECTERVPEDQDARLEVSIDDLAERVIGLYWRQLQTFVVADNPGKTKEEFHLHQHRAKRALILEAIDQLRVDVGTQKHEIPVAMAKRHFRSQYEVAVERVGRLMCAEPLRRLQEVPKVKERGAEDFFLYDDAGWMRKSIGRARIDEHGDAIHLHAGVAAALAKLGGLVKPALQAIWVEEVLKWNPGAGAQYGDVKKHLFGQDQRISTKKATLALQAEHGPDCFYCEERAATNLDHVLPRWRVGIDGLANLVPACKRCNSNKSGLLPAPGYVVKALERTNLQMIADAIEWPLEWERVRSSARGLFLSEPKSPAWLSAGETTPVEDLLLPVLLRPSETPQDFTK